MGSRRGKYRLQLLATGTGFLVLASCITVTPGTTRSEVSKYYFGLVKLVTPETDPRITAFNVKTLGLSIDNGLTLGWRSNERVLVPLRVSDIANQPYEATCSIVVIVRSNLEAAHAAQVLRSMEGERVCVTQF